MKDSIAKLNSNNYQIWKFKMNLFLLKEGVWSVVEKAIADKDAYWKTTNGRDQAIIGL